MKKSYNNIRIMCKIMLIAILMMTILKIPIVYAIENDSSDVHIESTQPIANDEATIGRADNTAKSPEKEDENKKLDKSPSIEEATVLGEYNKSETGVGYFKDISIALIGENLTDNHFLTPEGLHWSDKTSVELIQGNEIGNYDFSAFPNEAPNREVKAYRIENGDSGRLTYVGKTKSGVDLDIVWTIIDSDKSDWEENSGYLNTGTGVKGVAFTGEQFFRGGSGNSIAVLYNRASNLGINYKIVKHGTFEEMPVILSFISSDIDSAQGVETDLANIVEIIPPDSNLVKKDGVIYDSQGGVVNLNGSTDLPKGGYLGAGFLSSFNYVFYSPAPDRVNDSYYYPIAVRYDIFGSSLQAKLLTRINRHITVEYVDKTGKELKPKEFYKGFTDESYTLKSLVIPKYKLINIAQDESDVHHPVVKFIYSPEYEIRFKFVDENGKSLSNERKYTFLDGKEINYKPIDINGYELPSEYKGVLTKDTEHIFVYKKVKTATPKNSNTVTTTNDTGHHTVSRQYETINNNANIVGTKKGNEKPSTIAPDKKTETRDPFLINTKMSKDEKKQFLDYIKEIARQAREKYGNNKHKINHVVANAIAYSSYSGDLLQSNANEFGKMPNVINYEYVSEFLYNVHADEKYLIDFPHLATILASAKDSGKGKSIIKWIAGLSISNLWGNSPKDNFFQQNSLTGDILSNIDDKDYRSDIDAIIFHYHPDFKDLTLDEAIIKYYHMENLDIERERLYKEVLELQADKGVTGKEQELLNIFSAIASFGGLGLIAFTLLKKGIKELKEFMESPSKYMSAILAGIGSRAELFAKDPLQFIGTKVLGPISNLLADSISLGGRIINTLGKKLYYNAIEPVVKFVNKNIIQQINKNIVKPILKHVFKPVLSFAEKIILKPVVQKVIKPTVKFVNKKIIQPIKNKIIKPAIKFVGNKIVKPVIKKVIKPVAKYIHKNIIKPAYNKVVKPVYNKVVRPVVQPIYKKVIKPAAKYIHRNVVKPVTKFVKNKIAKPIGRFFKRLWR